MLLAAARIIRLGQQWRAAGSGGAQAADAGGGSGLRATSGRMRRRAARGGVGAGERGS